MKGLAALRAEIDAPREAPGKVLTNTEQRWNALGNGRAIEIWGATPVARPNIESAAREGYLDALSERGFSRHYDDAPGPWQRNYEIGRFWAVGMKVCGIEPPAWPEGMTKQPDAITRATQEIALKIGAIRPEIEGIKAASDDLPVLHEPIRLPRRNRR